jgi:glycerate dehydrogenase
MKIVVLDGYALNPGDLSWSELEKIGSLKIYDRTPVELIVERAEGAEIVLTNKTPIGEKDFALLPNLKYVGVLATGYNVVDVEAAKKRNIIVTNIPAYSTRSVAQMTFALLLELCQHVQKHSDSVYNDDWINCKDFCYWNYPLIELAGKTMWIIGLGSIGKQVADIAAAFGMNVIGYSRSESDQSHRNNFKWVKLEELFKQSDVISLHCPLFEETKGIINKNSLEKMKKSVLLLNTSRGQLIVEKDLAEALNNGTIAGAGLDVLSTEPPKPDNPLLIAKNCLITPHISWATMDARVKLMDIAVENIKAFINNNTVNVVNK